MNLTVNALLQQAAGGEANLVIPNLNSVTFLGVPGGTLLIGGLVVCALGLLFGLAIYTRLKNMAVHESMRAVSELIYETCKTYLITQGKFILILEFFIGIVIALYFGVLQHFSLEKVVVILAFSLIGIAGSYGVAWFGIRVNTFANSRTSFAALRGKPYPCYAIPLSAGMSIGMLLISVELVLMLTILLFIPGEYAGSCFIGFAIGESLGAAALRIAGGIFTKIADIGADLMKIVFNVKEDDARNPGVIADCTGDNAGDSVGPSADGFETYGVTGVALISFIVLAVKDDHVKVQLLVWIFVMRIMMVVTSGLSYLLNAAIAKARYADVDKMNFEAPLTFLVWLTSILSVVATFVVSKLVIPDLGDGTLWWKLSAVITCGTLAGAIIPEFVKVFTSVDSRHTKEVVISSREGGPSLNILSGLVAGQFQRVLAGHHDHGADDDRVLRQHVIPAGGRCADGRSGRVRLRSRGVRIPGHGPGHDRRRLVRSGDGQRAVGVRAVADRADPGRRCPDPAAVRLPGELRARQALPRGERRRGEHVQGDGQAGAHRHGGRRRDDDDLFDHRGAHERPHDQHRQTVAAPPAVPPRVDHRRRDHLLVHRRVHPGGDDGRLPRGRVHQGEHEPREHGGGLRRRLEEGRRDLHEVRAGRHVQHLPDGLLRHARLRVLRAVLLHRLSDFDRAVRICIRRSSWRTPAARGTTRRRSSKSN